MAENYMQPILTWNALYLKSKNCYFQYARTCLLCLLSYIFDIHTYVYIYIYIILNRIFDQEADDIDCLQNGYLAPIEHLYLLSFGHTGEIFYCLNGVGSRVIDADLELRDLHSHRPPPSAEATPQFPPVPA